MNQVLLKLEVLILFFGDMILLVFLLSSYGQVYVQVLWFKISFFLSVIY